MRTCIISLKLVLDNLDGPELTGHSDSHFIQSCVYLLQRSGFNLGYAFKWFGCRSAPHSIDLAWNILELRRALAFADDESRFYKFNSKWDRVFTVCRDVATVPAVLSIDRTTWLEFLSATDYLTCSKYRPDTVSDEQVAAFLKSLYVDRIPNYEGAVESAKSALNAIYAQSQCDCITQSNG